MIEPWEGVCCLDLGLLVPSLLDLSLVHQHQLLIVHVGLGPILLFEEQFIPQLQP